MRVLVTGGAGFIGSNLVEHLLAAGGYKVVILDNLSAGQGALRLPPRDRVLSRRLQRSIMIDALRGVDAVVHLAALSGVIDSIEDPRPSFEVNVAGTFQLLELARHTKVGRIINASTGGALLGHVATTHFRDHGALSAITVRGFQARSRRVLLGIRGRLRFAVRYTSFFQASMGHDPATRRVWLPTSSKI